MVGKSISHYNVLEELGRGGMGIVYKAEDTKLDRTVAIKVLPSTALTSEDDRARFYREAKAAAQLHHPHIASVFEIDEAVPEGSKDDDLRPFIAMEYIEGDTLSERIESGPLALKEALKIAAQVSRALDAAHAKGIVHRDIKSGNVMLSSSGEAKVLDFGLAQTAQSTKLTQMGSTLGTVAYMSPEQARGEAVDERTDLWSLGVILYEMISGRHPFPGDYEQAIVYSLLNQEPDPLTSIRTGVPMQLEWLIGKLLAKQKDERYHTAQEVEVDIKRIDLKGSGETHTASSSANAHPTSTVSSASSASALPIRNVALIVGIAILCTYLLTSFLTPSEQNPPNAGAVFSILNPVVEGENVSILPDQFAISRDGQWIAFIGHALGEPFLFKRRIDELESQMIARTDEAQRPFFSQDGRWIGFFSNQRLMKVLVEGGQPELVTRETGLNIGGQVPAGAAWTSDNTVFFPLDAGIAKVDANGGPVNTVATPEPGSSFAFPALMPDPEKLLITIVRDGNRGNRIATLDLSTGNVQIILDEEGMAARFAPTGHIVFARAGLLMSADYDAAKNEITSSPTIVSSGYEVSSSSIGFDFADAGTLVTSALSGDSLASRDWIWVNQEGLEQPIFQLPSRVNYLGSRYPRISPDGSKITFLMDGDAWIYDFSQVRRITANAAAGGQVIWSPDGEFLAFSSDNARTLSIKSINLSEPRQVVHTAEERVYPVSWSPDGNALAFYYITETSGRDIWMLNLEDTVATPYLVTSANERTPSFSPDGRWIAYISDELDRDEIFVDSFPERVAAIQVSIDGGREPVWSADGRYLYYRDGTRMIRATVSLEPTFAVLETEELFRGPYRMAAHGPAYGLHPDGQRFIMLKDAVLSNMNTLVVEQNWFSKF